jgi:hypothetical protein
VNSRRASIALLAAAAASAVFATRVYVGIDPVRVKPLPAPVPAVSGSVDVALADDKLASLKPPFAVIARIHNEAATPLLVSLSLDGGHVCDASIPATSKKRIDCAARGAWNTGVRHELRVTSPASPWTLEYAELATHHGNSTTPLTLYVLPDGSAAWRHPRVWQIGLAGLLVAALFLLEPRPIRSRAGRIAGVVLMLVALLLIAVASGGSFVSPYLIVLSPGTFALLVALTAPSRVWPRVDVALRRSFEWSRLHARTAIPRSIGRTRTAIGASWRGAQRAWSWCVAHQDWCAVALAVIVTAVAIRCGTRAVGGADPYGYLSEADLFLKGDLKIEQPWVREASWPFAEHHFAPLAYAPDPRDRGRLVPIYSPGLPMLLAVAKLVAREEGEFWVVPLTTGLLVLVTYGVGRRLRAGGASLAGAWLVATSPTVLIMATSVMTDVPVAAAWVGAFYFILGDTIGAAVGAGLLASIALLIRPNLAPLAGILALRYLLGMREPAEGRPRVLHIVPVYLPTNPPLDPPPPQKNKKFF